MSSLKNKVVLISGGSRGLGLEITNFLLDKGATVASFSRSPIASAELEKLSKPKKLVWEQIDAADRNSLKAFVNKLFKNHGRIDGLINNAAIMSDKLLAFTSPAEIERIISINVTALICLTKLVVKKMMLQNHGAIINLSSISALRGFKGMSTYGASKAAIDGFTRGLARELGGKNIRVNSIAPGFMDTDMTGAVSEQLKQQILRRTPANRLGTTEDILGAVELLLSEKSNQMTGQTLVIDGGLTC